MNGLTRFFLVFLRLAIGWHFLFEGLEKIESIQRGPTDSQKRVWSSEVYLQEAAGPLGPFMRSHIGDPDEAALKRLTVQPLPPDQDPAKTPAHQLISPALEKDWDAYFDRFVDHYELDGLQRKLAEEKLKQSKEQAVRWLQNGVKEIERSFPSTTVKLKLTTPQRIQEYQQKLNQLRDSQKQVLSVFERDVLGQRLRADKAEVSRLRGELLADLQQLMTDALQSVLRDDQNKKGPVPQAVHSWREWSRLEWLDRTTAWGLTAIGACLLAGLFTRTACIAAALFLLMLYLTVPPFPWLPEVTRAEGHYLFVNKNLIEMLALLALAATRSGRWAGLDGFIYFLNPFRRQSSEAARAAGSQGRALQNATRA